MALTANLTLPQGHFHIVTLLSQTHFTVARSSLCFRHTEIITDHYRDDVVPLFGDILIPLRTGFPSLYHNEVWEGAPQTHPSVVAPQELLDTLQQEKLSLEQCISKLRENVSGLEEQTKELKEREKLLVFFPELHIPVETQFESKAQGSGQQCLLLQQQACTSGVSWSSGGIPSALGTLVSLV